MKLAVSFIFGLSLMIFGSCVSTRDTFYNKIKNVINRIEVNELKTISQKEPSIKFEYTKTNEKIIEKNGDIIYGNWKLVEEEKRYKAIYSVPNLIYLRLVFEINLDFETYRYLGEIKLDF